MHKINRLKINYLKSQKLKYLNYSKSKRTLSVHLLTAMCTLKKTGGFNLLSLSKVLDNFSLCNLQFMQYGGHLAKTESLLEFELIGNRIPPVAYSLFYNLSV